LEDEGFEVIDAGSGETALEMLGESRIDAAIVDIRLSGMDGDAFIEHAHALDSNLRFLVCTGSVDYHLPERFLKLGISEAQMFIKPFGDLAALTNALKTILKEREDHEREPHAADYR